MIDCPQNDLEGAVEKAREEVANEKTEGSCTAASRIVSRAKVIPHPRGRGNSPLLPEMVVCYCRVLGLNFFL